MNKYLNKEKNNVVTLDKYTTSTKCDVLSKKRVPAKGQGEVKTMEGNKPVYKIKVGGVEVAVWENKSGTNGTFETISMHRSYKDKDDKWQKTQTLRTSDIPKAIIALQKAYEKIVLKEQ